MPTPYNIKQPAHPDSGRQYTVTVEGDTKYIQDGTVAIEVGPAKFVLPYKKAPAGNTQWVNVFSIPFNCDIRDPLNSLDLEAKSGATSLGGPRTVTVHDVT